MSIFAVLAASSAACSSDDKKESDSRNASQHVRFQFGTATATPETANVIIAKYLGYYKQEGIDATFSFGGHANVVQNLELLKQNKAQVSFVSASPLLNAAAQGKPFGAELICNVVPTGIYKIIVPEKSSIRTVADLAGKDVGTSNAGDALVPFVKAAMTRAGVSPDSAKFHAIGVGAGQITALRSGVVDAVGAVDSFPITAHAKENGFRVLPDPPGANDYLGPALGAMPSWVKAHSSLTGGLLRATAKGAVFAQANPRATLQILWKMYPAAKPAGKTEAAAMTEVLPMLRARLKSMELPAGKQFCAFTEKQWQTTADFLGVKDKIHDFGPYYTNQYVKAAGDFDASAIRGQAQDFKLN